MATSSDYNFKSSGIKFFDKVKLVQSASVGGKIPLSIATPLRLGTSHDGFFKMHFEPEDMIADNLRNLILTNSGERLGRYKLGANLRPLVFELQRDDFESEAMMRISNAVAQGMPYVNLETMETNIENENNQHVGRIIIRITYGIPKKKITGRVLEVILYAGG